MSVTRNQLKSELRRLTKKKKRKESKKKFSKAKKLKNKRLENHKRKYYKYLKSKEWTDIKIDLYQTRGKKCEVCGSINRIEVHHVHYKNVFKEEPEDLILLCKNCHKKEHNIK